MTVATSYPAKTLERPRMRRALEGVTPYQPGMDLRGKGFGARPYTKLSSNENPFGPSPRAIAAAVAALAHPEIYPDSGSVALKAALGDELAVEPARIVVGPGSEALIDYLFRAFLGPGDTVLISRPTFPSYEIFARSAGAEIIDAPRTADFDLDVDAIRLALRRRPKALALCTPNNPTAGRTALHDLESILEFTPSSTLVLLDEAYLEFSDEASGLDLLERWGGVFLLIRTFSKAYGLAGLRVGYGVASDPGVVAAMDRLRPAFNVAAPSQAAALAALADQEPMRRAVASIVSERERVEAALTAAGLRHTSSRASFVFVRAPEPAHDGFENLLRAGIIVRPIRVDEDDWLRITIGRPADNDRWLAQLTAGAG